MTRAATQSRATLYKIHAAVFKCWISGCITTMDAMGRQKGIAQYEPMVVRESKTLDGDHGRVEERIYTIQCFLDISRFPLSRE